MRTARYLLIEMIDEWRHRQLTHMMHHSVHTPLLGIARSLLASGMLLALVATPTTHLFYVSATRPTGLVCDGISGYFGLFCLVPTQYLELARWVAVAILLVVTAGWRPRITGVLHWWVSFSFYSSTNVMDGGDQVAAVITFLLIPICLTDDRRWHWYRGIEHRPDHPVARVVSHMTLLLIWIQTSLLYLQSSVEKLKVPEWRDGTAVWYWLTMPPFGANQFLQPSVTWLLSHAPIVLAATWGTIAIEFFVACTLFAGHRLRRCAAVLALGLHTSIALVIGLPVFSTMMFAVLLLYCFRPGDPRLSLSSPRLSSHDRRTAESTAEPISKGVSP
ncbi:antimicrobial peptide system protein, SdpB family [Actinopolyspora mzabensis]|uniref:Antimicrobial peptide system protein, SdpB family n=1 Tax=Actinopolyspora mzabensis TaxID=995066 RepID=A0A1G9CDN7_ACTMZ|nr:sporulation-delaying protein SdpB family protein [Actinopolyspora mzabensis]SDK49798.1 antimicrobial peptide system protein, SdpB family [Actinopolyspora mzabensis]